MLTAIETGVRTLELRNVPDLTPPDDGVLLQVKACGVCGSDLRRWREGPPPGVGGFVPGHEVAGEIIAVGKQVQDYRVGDRLALGPDIHCGRCYYCRHHLYNLCVNTRFLGVTPSVPGGFAEQVALGRDVLERGIVHRIPDGLGYDLGAMAEPCSSVLATHDKLGTSLNDTVVIIGAGPTGALLTAVAKARGARVFVSQRSPARRELVRRFGPDEVIDPTQVDVVEQVRELTGGLGADIAICANPVAATQAEAVRMVRKGGKVVLFGGLPKAAPMTTLDANLIHYGEIEVMGAFSYHPNYHALALDLFAQGVIPADRLITHRFPLHQIQQAFETADNGQGLKVLIEFE